MLELIQKGGPMMWVILACSVAAAAIFLERLLHLHRAQIRSADFLKGICNVLQRKNTVEAISICEETPGPVAHLVRAAILHHDEPPAQMRQAVVEAGLQEIPRLETNLNMLATLTRITPLLGLLGTVLGMMKMLAAIEQNAPLVHAGVLSAGLWQALISTAAGLAVAVPAYAGYHFLVGRVEAILLDMERAASEIMVFLQRQDRPGNVRLYEPAATNS